MEALEHSGVDIYLASLEDGRTVPVSITRGVEFLGGGQQGL